MNQLVSATVGENTVNFAYDYLGRRIMNGTTMYLYDGVDISEEVNATTGATSRRFVQGTGSDEHLAIHKGGLWYYYEQDGLGSVTSLTDTTGAVVAGYTYSSFGKSTEDTGTFSQPYRFTGREWDGNIHLYYYRARYYDPTIGRFISEDPIRFRAGVNFYSYVLNAPTNLIDPFGLDVTVYWLNGLGGNPSGHIVVSVNGSTPVGWDTKSPAWDKLAAANETVPGAVKAIDLSTRKIWDQITIKTTAEQDKSMNDFIANRRDHDHWGYNLSYRNCAQFARSVLEAAGIDLPGWDVKPKSLMNNVHEYVNSHPQ